MIFPKLFGHSQVKDGFDEKSRTIYIREIINDERAKLVIAQMLYLQSISNKDITIDIDSNGGAVTSGLAIYDTIRTSKCNIKVHCSGKAHSLAAIILSSGSKGSRSAVKQAAISFSLPYSSEQNKSELQLKEIKRLTQILCDITSEETKQEIKTVQKSFREAKEFTAQDAKDFGIIDVIKN